MIAADRLLALALAAAINDNFVVMETASSLDDAERILERRRPRLSVLVADPPFADVSLQEVCTRLVGRHPSTNALVLFREWRPHDLTVACQHGARGLFDTSITTEELVQGLERIARDEVAMQPVMLHDLMHDQSAAPEGTELGQPLTAIQVRALSLLAAGYTSKEIASQMNVTTAAVNHSLERAGRRLGARHRAETVARAIRLGLIA